jgi:Ca2+-binding RTX toxin-like protein
MAAGDGIDILNGGEGNDRLLMGRGDSALGGAGNDVFEMDTRWTDGAGQFVVEDLQRGQDRLELTYTPVYDPVTGVETLPTLAVSLAPGGESSLITLNGVTIATINGVKDLALSDLQLVRAVINDSAYDPTNYATQSFGTDADGTLTATGSTAHFAQGGNDQFTGSSARDYADMGLGNDRADLGAGDDSALGGEGGDTLGGGDGNDALRGGNGADRLAGDAGDDQLIGGAGADDLAGGAGNDSLDGGADDDTLLAGDGQDVLLGGSGSDSLDAGAGNDSLDGGTDNDQLSGGFGADTIYGGLGNDTISGFDVGSSNPDSSGANEGSDLIYGGAGLDRIWAGTGDRVYGGADNDIFLLDENRYDANAIPRLEDFATGDKIEIHYDTGTTPPVITLAPSGLTGETNVLADGQIVAKVVHGAVPLTLIAITTVAN